MREFKFRAWKPDDNEFAGDYDTGDYSTVDFDSDGNATVYERVLTCHCAPDSGCGGCADDYNKIENAIIMQYTGLKDNSGAEIYEGDVVDCKLSFEGGSLPHRGEIIYVDKYGAFATRNLAGETLLHNHILSSFEIQGNIYEAPELLKDLMK